MKHQHRELASTILYPIYIYIICDLSHVVVHQCIVGQDSVEDGGSLMCSMEEET